VILTTEERLTRNQAAEFMGVCGPTITSWARDGLLGVYLEAHWVGLRRYYTRDGLLKFQQEVNAARQPVEAPKAREASRRHDAAMERVRQRCARR
jgi:hypothetical protein